MISRTPRFATVAAAAALCAASLVQAEDIDLYTGVEGSTGGANVLFFIDNTSNWSNNREAWSKADSTATCNAIANTIQKERCLSYVQQIFGNSASLVQGVVQLRALRLVLNELVCGPNARLRVNAGIMMLNDRGTADTISGISGYIRHRIAPLDEAQCKVVLNDLESMANRITDPDVNGPSSADYGSALYEAFKYFGGWTNPAGAAKDPPQQGTPNPNARTGFGNPRYSNAVPWEDPLAFTDGSRTSYRSPISADLNCGNNYIVLVGNAWPNQEQGTNQNANPPTNTTLTRLGYNTTAAERAQVYNVSNKSDIRFADEWARFLYNTDVSEESGIQRIGMFTVDVFNRTNSSSSTRPKQAQLLKSIADQSGQGGYFSVGGDLYGLISAFADILTQVASEDSVFASASLPVSVNAQGTFLNQVFMGVFRPDGAAQQRWAGNLKQYRFKLDGRELLLSDKDGNLAVDAKNTGFLQACATSYWTTDSGNYWASVPGSEASSCVTSTNDTYSDAPDGPLVERGGAGQRLRELGHASRKIQTCTDLSCGSIVNFTDGLSGIGADLAKWVRGQNLGDGNVKGSTGEVTFEKYGRDDAATRPTVHGAVIHSRPLAINYGASGVNDIVVFYGADDGMLRAVDGNQSGTGAGNELWAFVAPEHWQATDKFKTATTPSPASELDRVRLNKPLVSYPNIDPALVADKPIPKSYFFGGSTGGYQERTSGAIGKIWIYPTMRRGGRTVYAFDATANPKTGTPPKFMWKYGPGDDSRMGQSWSTPVVFRVEGSSAPYVAFGAGYDECEDQPDAAVACASATTGQGVVVLDAEQGKTVAGRYRFIGVGTGGFDSSAGRFVADLAPVDVNADGYVDVLYAVDTRGNVWRINTSDPSTFKGKAVGDWIVNKIAVVSDWAGPQSERRKFMYAPSTVVLGTQVTVLVGTGDREKPSSSSSAAQTDNRFYGFRDDVTKTTGIVPAIGYGVITTGQDLTDLKNVTYSDPIDPTSLSAYKGWFRELTTQAEPYEQVVTTPLTLAGVTYFSTFQAKTDPAKTSKAQCVRFGTARWYQIDFQTGAKLPSLPLTGTFLSEGFPPSPVGGLVEVDNKLVPFVIGGPAETAISPKRVNPVIRADRKPVYRFQRIDEK